MTEMRRWVIPALAIALVGTSLWGFTQYRARMNWELQAENNYQRAFHELSYHLDGTQNLLSKASVVNSQRQTSRVFSDVWRHTYSAQQNLSQLPLTNIDLSRTKTFLANLQAFSSRQTDLAVDGKTVSESDWKNIRSFKSQAEFLAERLRQVQVYVLDSAARWVEEETPPATAAAGSSRDNTGQITKNFIMVEDGLRRIPDPSFDGNTLNIKAKPVGLTGSNVTAQQALDRAQAFLSPRKLTGYNLRVSQETRADMPGYMIEAVPPRDDGRKAIRMEFSKRGGHPMWMLEERNVMRSRHSMDKAIQAGAQFLQARGYRNMGVAMAADYQNIASVTYVPVVNDVLVYPDMVKLQIARDNLQVLGFDATSYLTFHKARNPQPKLSAPEARKKLNPHLQVKLARKAIVLNERFQEVLCHEFECTIGDDRFLVYINAVNGQEEKVRKITETGVEEL